MEIVKRTTGAVDFLVFLLWDFKGWFIFWPYLDSFD